MARNIFKILKRIREDIDNFMNERFDSIGDRFPEMRGFSYPQADIREKKGELVITLDMPGLDKEDIDVKAEEAVITVRAERKEEKEQDEKDYYKSERQYKGFFRKLFLPAKVEPEKTSARYENGVLTIIAKKAEEQEEGNIVNIE